MVDPGLVYGTWAIAVATGGFAWRQIVVHQEAERVRLAVIRRDRYESEEMQRYRRALARELRSLPPGMTLTHFDPAVPNFFDVTGALLRKKYLAKDLIRGFFGYAAKRYWRALEPTLRLDHDRYPDDHLWHDFKHLVDYVGGYPPTEDEMNSFWEEETNLDPYPRAYEARSRRHAISSRP